MGPKNPVLKKTKFSQKYYYIMYIEIYAIRVNFLISLSLAMKIPRNLSSALISNRTHTYLRYSAKKMMSCHTIADGGDRRDVVPDSAFTVFRARVNAHLARAPTAL